MPMRLPTGEDYILSMLIAGVFPSFRLSATAAAAAAGLIMRVMVGTTAAAAAAAAVT